MKPTALLSAAFVAVLPVAALACAGHDARQAWAPMEGYTWNETAGACAEIVNS